MGTNDTKYLVSIFRKFTNSVVIELLNTAWSLLFFLLLFSLTSSIIEGLCLWECLQATVKHGSLYYHSVMMNCICYLYLDPPASVTRHHHKSLFVFFWKDYSLHSNAFFQPWGIPGIQIIWMSSPKICSIFFKHWLSNYSSFLLD